MGFTGGLEKLLIEAYADESYAKKDGELRLWINPEKYTRTYSICYNDRQAQGSPGGSPEFNRIPTEEMKLEASRCPHCGARTERLHRGVGGRMLAGVCAGLALFTKGFAVPIVPVVAAVQIRAGRTTACSSSPRGG